MKKIKKLDDPCPWCGGELWFGRERPDFFTQCEDCEFEIEHDTDELIENAKKAAIQRGLDSEAAGNYDDD